MMFNPKTEALAFRIWAHCEPLGWDTDVKSIAAALGDEWHRIAKICQNKNWIHRLRKASTRRYDIDNSGSPLMSNFGVGEIS